jgi:DNA polymerase IV (archaeal DinB-like DNA polymerase)
MQERIILLLDMDYFFAQIEERENPRFQGKPVVVGADPKHGQGRGVVSTCNYEARKYGIHSALPISQAYKLCPEAIFLPVQGELYGKVSEKIMEGVRAFFPGCPVELVSLDEGYVDISNHSMIVDMRDNQGKWNLAKVLAEKLKEEVLKQQKLTCTIGIGPNKMVAKIACEKAKPNGVMVAKSNDAARFLLPLNIQEIPGVGLKTAVLLERFFKKKELKVQDVKKASKEALQELLGVFGITLYQRVRGVDKTPVCVEEKIKSIGKEHTFEKDTRHGEEILLVFRNLLSDVAKELQEQELSFKTITVVCRFQGFQTYTKSKTLKESSKDGKLLEKESIRLLLKFLTENLKPLRLVGVRIKIAKEAQG